MSPPQSPQARTLPDLSLQASCSITHPRERLLQKRYLPHIWLPFSLPNGPVFHFVILPLTPARLPNKPTMGNHGQPFPFGETPCKPNHSYYFGFYFLIIVLDSDKVVLAPLSYCGLETETTGLELKNKFFLRVN